MSRQRGPVTNGTDLGMREENTRGSVEKQNMTSFDQGNGTHIDGQNGYSSQQSKEPGENQGILGRIVHFTLVPLFLMVFSPNIVVFLWYAAVNCNGSLLVLFQQLAEEGYVQGVFRIWMELNIAGYVSTSIILGYCVFALVLMVILPGPVAYGPVTPKGNIPVYKDNGMFCYLVTMVTLVILTYVLKTYYGVSTTIVYDHFGEFLGTLTVFSGILCIFLQIKGLNVPSTTDCGSSGNVIFDYYWGTELYPRVCGIDMKVFTNCRFGMTVWPMLVMIHAFKSYELHGFVDSIWVSCFLQMVYFTKFFWWESGYMRTIDIMVDRAGYYICWGCLVFVPGMYASVSMYLVNQPIHLGPYLSGAILLLGTASVTINYIADKQKQDVRSTNGKCLIWGKKPEVLVAKYQLENGDVRESLLLLSGWWGVARHFHYVPEILLAFCWTVPAGFNNLAPYAYIITLICILVHRTFRDDEKCSKKYGQYWDDYCKRVPYKIIPGIF